MLCFMRVPLLFMVIGPAITAGLEGRAPVLSRAPIFHQNLSGAPHFSLGRLWELQKQFYNNFTYPSNIQVAKAINSTIFTEDVLGRVSDTRGFAGRELNTEYIFGLFIPTDGISLIGQPINYTIVEFAANQNIASASTLLWFVFPSFGNARLPVMLDTWITWNAAGQISQYDATFRWFDYLVSTLFGLASSNATTARGDLTELLSSAVCATHDQYCAHANSTQYNSTAECLQFLAQDIRLGQSFELGMNTLLCRNLHRIMVPFRPAVHCPHIGPSGGGMCVDDTDYTQKVTQPYFTNSRWIAAGLEGPASSL